VKIDTLSLRNFRSLKTFQVGLQGESAFFIGANGAGKSSLLRAINLVLARERVVTRFDFSDVAVPFEIDARIVDLTDDEATALKAAIDFGPPITLQLRFRAQWDPDAEEATAELILPAKKNSRSLSVTERDALAVLSLPAQRDPARMLELGRRRTVLEQLIQSLALGQDLDRVAAAVDAAQRELGESNEIAGLFAKVTANLRNLRPTEGVESLAVAPSARTQRELLAGLQVEYSQDGTSLPMALQSAGLAQMISFAFLAHHLATARGTVVVIDEPETSLHPHAQRALTRLLAGTECQVLLATHSASLLERADVRRVFRLFRTGGETVVRRPSTVTDKVAKQLRRFTSPQVAESFFARSVILVEGPSDKLALQAAAEKLSKDLDSRGASIIELDGANTLATFLKLVGKTGFDLPIYALCDADKESLWRSTLQSAGYGTLETRADLEAFGFLVADRDLEDELIRALGVARVKAAITNEGDDSAWATFQKQGTQRGLPELEQLRNFIQVRTARKVQYAPVLVDLLQLHEVPNCLARIINGV